MTDEAQRVLIEMITGAKRETVVRRNPLDSDDVSESQELESEGFALVNRGSLLAGVSELLRDVETVAETHNRLCKAHFRRDANFSEETDRERRCMAAFVEIASAFTGRRITCQRVRGGSVAAAYRDGVISLNIDVDHIWSDPLGEQSLGLLIHECAHDKVSGHAVEFRDEVERLGARLDRWVGDDHKRWDGLKKSVCRESATVGEDTQ